MKPISTNSAEHYKWGNRCDGWHLLAGDDLSVIEERMPPGTSELRHRHARARQFFYVLEGEAVLELEGAVQVLHPGQGLHVPPGAAHQVCNDKRVMATGSQPRHLVYRARSEVRPQRPQRDALAAT